MAPEPPNCWMASRHLVLWDGPTGTPMEKPDAEESSGHSISVKAIVFDVPSVTCCTPYVCVRAKIPVEGALEVAGVGEF